MSQPDPFEGIVDDVFEEEISPSLPSSAPDVSSGVSSGAGGSQTSNPPLNVSSSPVLNCEICSKSYKTIKGYENHILIVHKLQKFNEANSELFVSALTQDLVLLALKEMVDEYCDISDDLKRFCEDSLDSFERAPSLVFVNSLSDLCVAALKGNNKLLPTNQFENFLSKVNAHLNDTNVFENLKESLSSMLESSSHKDKVIGMVVSRLTFKVAEELFFHIIRECRGKKSTVETSVVTLSDKEKLAFESHANKVFQSYFRKAYKHPGDVWRRRCLCMRKMFVINTDSDIVSSKDLIASNAFSQGGNVKLSPSALDCFIGIETCIKSLFTEKSSVHPDTVFEKLMDVEFESIVSSWNCLASDFLPEYDLLVFLKDFVNMFTSLSVRLQTELMNRCKEKKKKLQKVSLRATLKHNLVMHQYTFVFF